LGLSLATSTEVAMSLLVTGGMAVHEFSGALMFTLIIINGEHKVKTFFEIV
jgi:hypothetical protein